MPSNSIRQLIDDGVRSGLFSGPVAEGVVAQLCSDDAQTTGEIVSRLVESRILTSFQAEQLQNGRGDECIIAGRYRILEKLGEGGMGTVYKAHDTQLDRDVAVKVLPARSLNDPDAVARFQREARALAKLSHPNIIQAFDSGQDRDRYFLVMEYVEGSSLSAVLRQHGAIPPTLAADFIYQAALGLQHAQEKGLVHRDLKPGNLLLTNVRSIESRSGPATTDRVNSPLEITTSYVPKGPGTGVIKLLDLGLARFVQDQIGDAQLTKEGIGVGTPDYMAPEQFRDALHADARTDIYGLGCTLYQLIGGSVPFPGSSFSEKADAHARKEPIPLEERCPEVPAGLAFVVSKMMAKHPADRFQSAAEVSEALAPFVAGASHSMIHVRNTMRIHAGQLTMRAPRRGRQILAWVGGGVGAACLVTLLILAWPSIFPPKSRAPSGGDQSQSSGLVAPAADPARPARLTIENGLTVAKDGAGQFTTIGEALDKIKPGQTIRVLDAGIYPESLVLGSPSTQTNMTLEAVGGATIATVTTPHGNCLAIDGVNGVVVRGFRFRSESPQMTCIQVRGRVSGLRLADLEMGTGSFPDYDGILLDGTTSDRDDAPIVVENCAFRRSNMAITVRGSTPNYESVTPCRNIVLRNNRIIGPSGIGVKASGELRQIQIVGNRIQGTVRFAGIQLENVVTESEDILIANNTLFEAIPGFRLWDSGVKGKRVQVCNNLVLGATKPDMMFIDSGGSPFNFKGPGDGTALIGSWDFKGNWREATKPVGNDAAARSWIPPGSGDTLRESITVISRDPSQADFLRPAEDSPLANAGIGGDLPAYVGAVPPKGMDPWDWQKTWGARAGTGRKEKK